MTTRHLHLATAATALVVLSACGAGADGGGRPAESLPASDHVHALRADTDGTLLLGLHGALWRSDDGGTNWDEAGLEGQDAMAIGSAPDAGGPLLVGGHGILARSPDGSERFESLRPAELGSLDIHALAQAPSDPRVAYAFVVDHGIFATTDGGDTWELRSPPGDAFGADVTGMAVDPQDPETVLVCGGRTGIIRSADGARTFEAVHDTGAFALAYVPGQRRLAAITQRGIETSGDGGRTWTVASGPGAMPGLLAAIAADGDGTLWVVTEEPRTLQRSDDGGATWTEVARA